MDKASPLQAYRSVSEKCLLAAWPACESVFEMLSVRYASQFVGVLAKDGRIRNTLFQTEAGVYIKKLLSSTLPGVPRGRKTYFFPHIRVYTEKLSLYIHFFAISRVLTHNFSVYALFPHANWAKRGEFVKQRGIAEQFFSMYPAGFGQLPSTGVRRQSGTM